MIPKSLKEMKEYPIMPGQHLHGFYGDVHRKIGLIDSMSECLYTVTNFVTVGDLPECQKYGIKAIVVEDPFDGWHHRRCCKPEEIKNVARDRMIMDDEEIEIRAKKLVHTCQQFEDVVLGYYIFDEPSVCHFAYLKKICDSIRRYDRNRMLFINLFPIYASYGQLGVNGEAIEFESDTVYKDGYSVPPDRISIYNKYLELYYNTVQPNDIIRYDNFAVNRIDGVNLQKDKEAMRDYLENLVVVSEFFRKRNLIGWNTGCCTQIRPHTSMPTMANIALQAFTMLAAGYKGIGWFAYYKALVPRSDGKYNYNYAPIDDKNGEKTATYYMMREINRQTLIFGNILMDMECTKVYFRNVEYLECDELDCKSSGDVLMNVKGNLDNPPLMVGEFMAQDNNRWFMVVNLDMSRYVPVELVLADAYQKIEQVSLGSGKLLSVDVLSPISIMPGTGCLFKAS